MTGPEHYARAQHLLDRAEHFTYGDGADPVVGAACAAQAQAHATLAQVAATIDAAEHAGAGQTQVDALGQWRKVGV